MCSVFAIEVSNLILCFSQYSLINLLLNSLSPIKLLIPFVSLFNCSIQSNILSPVFFDNTNANNFLLRISTNNNIGVCVSPFEIHYINLK